MTRKRDETLIVRGKWVKLADGEEQPRKPRRKEAAKPAAPPKSSYERSPNVQRWLHEQAVAKPKKPEFNPSFLVGRRDRLWILSSLNHFYEEDLISDVLHVVRSGKEATVYCCRGGPAANAKYLAAKVYRPRMFRSLSNDAIYREGRTPRDENGPITRYSRRSGPSRGTEKGRVFQVSAWIAHEYQTLGLLHAAGAVVPAPLAQMGNSILMEYIGELGAGAPLLHEVALTEGEALPLFESLMRNVELCLTHHCIHGDLSAYNILYRQGKAVIIDVAQAVDPRQSSDAFMLLKRDIERTYRYFARYGVEDSPAALATAMWEHYLMGEGER